MTSTPPKVERLEDLAADYAVMLCDVWGVVHNGKRAHAAACEALARMRALGKAVIMITNAPRPHHGVEAQFATLGVPSGCWDRIVTSGDVTRALIAAGPRRIFHLGPDRDLILYDGLDVELVEEPEAGTVCCTGLFDDTSETPEDYATMLRRLRSRDLPMICANPDIVVERGDELVWCAGALARDYGLLGGRTLIAGKPHRPIYDAALAAAGEVLGREIGPDRVLAIGDGILTDIKGAADAGLDALYISNGIHAGEYGGGDEPDLEQMAAFLDRHGQRAIGYMPRLA